MSVSVPYWGSLYFNFFHIFFIWLIISVSVPYWGSLYFNQQNLHIYLVVL